MTAEVAVTPTDALLDEAVQITVNGLTPEQRVTLTATFRVSDRQYRGNAVFEADETGTVDVTTHAPVAGDYDGVVPMGLIQYARPTPETSDTADTLDHGFRVRLAVRSNDVMIAERTVVRRTLATGVERHTVEERDDELVGDLFVPAGDGPHPGVLLLGGSGGGVPSGSEAKLLASRGYAVLALAYFQPSEISAQSDGDRPLDRLPAKLQDVPLEYFHRGLDWLAGHDAVDGDRLVVHGGSRGSEPAVLVAAERESVVGVVLRVPLSHVFCSFQEIGDPAWTADGEAIPYLTNEFRLRDYGRWVWRALTDTGIPFARSFVAAIENAGDDERARTALPVENVDCPVFTIAGGDDELSASGYMAERIENASTDTRHQSATFPDAGHAISVPYTPVRGRATGDTDFLLGQPIALGGTADAYRVADERSWTQLRSFLADVSGKTDE